MAQTGNIVKGIPVHQAALMRPPRPGGIAISSPNLRGIRELLVFGSRANVVVPEQAMANYPYILFNKNPMQLRLLGARGGRTSGRNQRARRALMRAQPVPVPQFAAPGETTAQAIAALDAQFPWLCRAEKRLARTKPSRPLSNQR